MFIALGYLLPYFTGQIPEIGKMLCPMHIPAFLCGMICGPWYGLLCGVVMPLLRSAFAGTPVFFPSGIAMALELGTYGMISGLMLKYLPRKMASSYIALIVAMICGRAVSGTVNAVLMGISDKSYTFATFLTVHFANAWPGILLQLILIPALIGILRRCKAI